MEKNEGKGEDKVNKQWKSATAGFAVGLCVMLMISLFTGDGVRKERGKQSNAGMTENASEEINEAENAGTGNAGTGNAGTGNPEDGNAETENAEAENSPIRISDNVDVSQDFIEELLLYQYIEYGLRQFNETNNSEKQYYVDIRDMLPYTTEFCMKDENTTPFKTDLAKEMIPQLSNNIFNFELLGSDENIYMSIDTYNMKIYVYDDVKE